MTATALPVGSFPCRSCGTPLRHVLVDLGVSPLCQSLICDATYTEMEPFYALKAFVCHECHLAQVGEFVPPGRIFADYAYFSSYSDSWVEHARQYCVAMRDRLGLTGESHVVEVASNDGYLLQHFVGMGIPCLGIEPAANVAAAAAAKGVVTDVSFFGVETARRLAAEGRQADLVLGNNVLAQNPDLHDFVEGLKIVLKPGGTVTIEFPHLLATIEGNQFDQVYHEHFYYFSLLSAERIFARHGIRLFDVEELATHGGSLRVFGCHEEEARTPTDRLLAFRAREAAAGLERMETYEVFDASAREIKRAALAFLIGEADAGRQVVAYGAPGKGNTFLNYCGIGTDLIRYTVDRSPHKRGHYLPGSRIPVHHPDRIAETRPDTIVILPWNLRREIAAQLAYVRAWKARLVVFVPRFEEIAADATPGFASGGLPS